jgi:hypothetical protein
VVLLAISFFSYSSSSSSSSSFIAIKVKIHWKLNSIIDLRKKSRRVLTAQDLSLSQHILVNFICILLLFDAFNQTTSKIIKNDIFFFSSLI